MAAVGPMDALVHNALATRFPSLTLDVVLESTLPGGTVSTMRARTLSRFEMGQAGWKLDLMSRVTDGHLTGSRFLIAQRSDVPHGPDTWVFFPGQGNPARIRFEPWQPFQRCALRWMDYILPPTGSYTASFSPDAEPSDPDSGELPACWVVDLELRAAFWKPDPHHTRLWIQNNGNAVEHRVEQRLSTDEVRVVRSSGWRRVAPGSQFLPDSRVVVDPDLGIQTTVRVERADVAPLDPALFTANTMATGHW